MLMSRINNSPPLCWYIGDCRYILDHSYKSQWNQDFSPRYINAHLNFGPSLSLSLFLIPTSAQQRPLFTRVFIFVCCTCARVRTKDSLSSCVLVFSSRLFEGDLWAEG